MAVYAPSKPQSLDVNLQASAMYNATRSMIYEVNTTNLALGPGGNAALGTQLTVIALPLSPDAAFACQPGNMCQPNSEIVCQNFLTSGIIGLTMVDHAATELNQLI